MQVDLFTYNPEHGLDYEPSDEIGEESTENGVDDIEVSTERDILSDPVSVEEESTEVSETSDILDFDNYGNSDSDLLQQIADIQVETYAASNPVAGNLSSNTLDYFDRVVNGLPSDYKYVAYKTSSQDSYAGSLIYGKHVDVSGNILIFGEDSVELTVSRNNYSGTYYITYDSSDASGDTVSVSNSGNVLYYTNGLEGFPTLGDYRGDTVFPMFLGLMLFGFTLAFILRRFFKRD